LQFAQQRESDLIGSQARRRSCHILAEMSAIRHVRAGPTLTTRREPRRARRAIARHVVVKPRG
jgi:hypothetical protein